MEYTINDDFIKESLDNLMNEDMSTILNDQSCIINTTRYRSGAYKAFGKINGSALKWLDDDVCLEVTFNGTMDEYSAPATRWDPDEYSLEVCLTITRAILHTDDKVLEDKAMNFEYCYDC